jgi:hypothetical protein
MKHSPLIPALSAKAHAFSEHMGHMVDHLPIVAQASMPSRQAYYAVQLLEEHVARAKHARTNSTYNHALYQAMGEVRAAGYWLNTLVVDMPETARLCTDLHDEAGTLADLLAEVSY